MNWKTFAWLKRGKRRRAVLLLLSEAKHPLSINDIKNLSKIAISQASITINELFEKNLVECLNPEDKIGKLYIISDEGREYIESLVIE